MEEKTLSLSVFDLEGRSRKSEQELKLIAKKATANVRIVKLMTFGAFAEIVPGVDGLIHISQIADHRIEKPGDVLAEGEKVDVKITDIDMENKKVSLSIRALLEEPEAEEDAPAEE